MDPIRPLVSIVTPVYNGEKFLEETLLSVFAQTYPNYELIVVDDGSPSRACEKICIKYADKLKYIAQANTGLSGARNRALREAKGEYVAFIDQDDLWMPEKLEKQVALFESLKNKGVPIGLVYTPIIEMDENGTELSRSSHRKSGELFSELIYTNNVGTPSSVLVKKEALERVGYFDENLSSYSDWEIYIRIARHYQIHCLNEYLTRYRVSRGSLSENLELVDEDMKEITEKVLVSHKDFFSKKKLSREEYLRPIQREMAGVWKYIAYRKLFVYGDGHSFRKYIRQGWKKCPGEIGLKPWVYVALSYVSVSLCRALKRRKTTS